MAASTGAASAGCGLGTASSVAALRPSARAARKCCATSSGRSKRAGARRPDVGEKKAGNSSVWYAATHTPIVSRYWGTNRTMKETGARA